MAGSQSSWIEMEEAITRVHGGYSYSRMNFSLHILRQASKIQTIPWILDKLQLMKKMRKCQVQEAQQEIAAMLAGEGLAASRESMEKSSQEWRSLSENSRDFWSVSWKILKDPETSWWRCRREETSIRHCERNHWFCTGFTFNGIPEILPPQRYLWLGDSAVCGTQVESKMLRCYRSSVDCRLGMHMFPGRHYRDGINIYIYIYY